MALTVGISIHQQTLRLLAFDMGAQGFNSQVFTTQPLICKSWPLAQETPEAMMAQLLEYWKNAGHKRPERVSLALPAMSMQFTEASETVAAKTPSAFVLTGAHESGKIVHATLPQPWVTAAQTAFQKEGWPLPRLEPNECAALRALAVTGSLDLVCDQLSQGSLWGVLGRCESMDSAPQWLAMVWNENRLLSLCSVPASQNPVDVLRAAALLKAELPEISQTPFWFDLSGSRSSAMALLASELNTTIKPATFHDTLTPYLQAAGAALRPWVAYPDLFQQHLPQPTPTLREKPVPVSRPTQKFQVKAKTRSEVKLGVKPLWPGRLLLAGVASWVLIALVALGLTAYNRYVVTAAQTTATHDILQAQAKTARYNRQWSGLLARAEHSRYEQANVPMALFNTQHKNIVFVQVLSALRENLKSENLKSSGLWLSRVAMNNQLEVWGHGAADAKIQPFSKSLAQLPVLSHVALLTKPYALPADLLPKSARKSSGAFVNGLAYHITAQLMPLTAPTPQTTHTLSIN